MDPKHAKYRPLPFGVTLVAYLLPFLTMTCMGQSHTFSGYQVAFGTTVSGQKLAGEPMAVLVLICAAVGLVLSLKPALAAAIKVELACSAVSVVLLLALQSKIGSAAAKQSVQVSFQFGYWLALAALAAGCVLGAIALQSSPPTVPSDGPGPRDRPPEGD